MNGLTCRHRDSCGSKICLIRSPGLTHPTPTPFPHPARPSLYKVFLCNYLAAPCYEVTWSTEHLILHVLCLRVRFLSLIPSLLHSWWVATTPFRSWVMDCELRWRCTVRCVHTDTHTGGERDRQRYSTVQMCRRQTSVVRVICVRLALGACKTRVINLQTFRYLNIKSYTTLKAQWIARWRWHFYTSMQLMRYLTERACLVRRIKHLRCATMRLNVQELLRWVPA